MSFSGLSREMRNLIYHALLCPPDGAHLQSNVHRWAWTTSSGFSDSEEDEEEDDDGKDIIHRVKRSSTASAVIQVSTAIFYVSHQIRREASEVFYGFNRFTFDSTACAALEFLDGLRSSFRHYIKDLAFTRRSTCADDGDCTQFWEHLGEFINRHVSLNSVSVHVPRDCWHAIDKTEEAKEPPNSEWYWWPAPRLLTTSLMAGKSQKLRIEYSATLEPRNSEGDAQQREAGLSQIKDPLEDLDSISRLRYPRPQEERERELSESKALRSALAQGRTHEFGSLKELLADQQTRRQRFNFVVRRADDPTGDLGTVLVLTRSTASSGCLLD